MIRYTYIYIYGRINLFLFAGVQISDASRRPAWHVFFLYYRCQKPVDWFNDEGPFQPSKSGSWGPQDWTNSESKTYIFHVGSHGLIQENLAKTYEKHIRTNIFHVGPHRLSWLKKILQKHHNQHISRRASPPNSRSPPPGGRADASRRPASAPAKKMKTWASLLLLD